MRDVASVRRQAFRAYEVSRLRIASRVAAIVVPLAVLSACETGAWVACSVIGAPLLILTTGLRWWHRQGVDAVAIGLRTGGVATLVALGFCRFAPTVSSSVAASVCIGAGFLAGMVSGDAIVRNGAADWRRWTVTISVGALTAALGCFALGVGSLVGASLAVGVAGAAAAALPRAEA